MNTPQSLYAFTLKLISGKGSSIIIFPAWSPPMASNCSFRTSDSFCGPSLSLPFILSHFLWFTAFLWVPWTHQTHSYLTALSVAHPWTTASPDVCNPITFLFKFSRSSSHLRRPPNHLIQISPICTHSFPLPCLLFLPIPLPICTCPGHLLPDLLSLVTLNCTSLKAQTFLTYHSHPQQVENSVQHEVDVQHIFVIYMGQWGMQYGMWEAAGAFVEMRFSLYLLLYAFLSPLLYF